jgi:hypothetical protein
MNLHMFSFCLACALSAIRVATAAEATPERRALEYLSREVPRWSAENKCFSCHNNGDAARALYVATRMGRGLETVPKGRVGALADTNRWLSQPERWDKKGGDGPATDKGLARIQFAAALVEALDAGVLQDSRALARAADLVAEYQARDGSWKVDAKGTTGSPATYGTCLATHVARRTLQRADPHRFRQAIARADAWLRKVRVGCILDAAAVLLALEGRDDLEASRQRSHCLELVRKGQGKDGGWGPYVTSPSEPFDTAVVLLALVQFKDQAELKAMIQKGREYLFSRQRKDGSWPETTRPPGADSYAQRISTTGWATLAILATSP